MASPKEKSNLETKVDQELDDLLASLGSEVTTVKLYRFVVSGLSHGSPSIKEHLDRTGPIIYQDPTIYQTAGTDGRKHVISFRSASPCCATPVTRDGEGIKGRLTGCGNSDRATVAALYERTVLTPR